MKEAGKTFEPVTYEGAGHGFMRSGEDPAGQRPIRKRGRKAGEMEEYSEKALAQPPRR